MSSSRPEGRQVTLLLGAEATSDLQWISRQYGGIPLTDVIRRAVATEKYLLQQQCNGEMIVLENRQTGDQRELILR
jgi:hypothetical protein